MIPVSELWKTAIKKQFRNQAYLYCRILITPPGLHEGTSVKGSNIASCSDVNTVQNQEYDVTPYATLECNRWVLDGSYKLLTQDTVTDDVWADKTTTYLYLTFTFDNAYSIPGIWVEWDSVGKTYPKAFSATGYDTNNGIIKTYNFNNINNYQGFYDAPFDNVKKVAMMVGGWNCKNWRQRVNEVIFGFNADYSSKNNGRISGATMVDSSSPISKSLPKHKVTVTLRNTDDEFDPSLNDGVSKYLSRLQSVQYRYEFITDVNPATGETTVEATPWLRYWVDSFKIPKDSKDVTTVAVSRLQLIDNDFTQDVYTGSSRTMYDIAETILSKANLPKLLDDEVPWSISDKLKQFSTTAPIPRKAFNALLQLVANASACWLYSEPVNDVITIDEFESSTPVAEVTKLQQLGDPGINPQQQLRSISIGLYSYTKSSDQTTVGESKYNMSGRVTLDINYSCEYAMGVTCSVDGATLVSFTPYGSSATVVVDAGSTSKEFTVTLKGYKVESNVTYVETYNDSTITQGLDITIDNPFITDSDSLSKLSEWYEYWYTKKATLSVPYTGYPELTSGDSVNLISMYGTNVVKVTSNTITFNGGFSGELEVW